MIAVGALLMPAGILAVRAESAAVALALMCVVLFAFQVWINNVQTLPSDFFPRRAVGSVAGLGGFGARPRSMLFTLTTGWVVRSLFYTPIFTAAGLLGPVGRRARSRSPAASGGCRARRGRRRCVTWCSTRVARRSPWRWPPAAARGGARRSTALLRIRWR